MSQDFKFSEAANELDDIIEHIQSGELTLDDAIKKYKQAETLLKKLEDYLTKTENKLSVINPNDKE